MLYVINTWANIRVFMVHVFSSIWHQTAEHLHDQMLSVAHWARVCVCVCLPMCVCCTHHTVTTCRETEPGDWLMYASCVSVRVCVCLCACVCLALQAKHCICHQNSVSLRAPKSLTYGPTAAPHRNTHTHACAHTHTHTPTHLKIFASTG